MKKWIWLLLAVVVAFAAIGSSGLWQQHQQSAVIETVNVENSDPAQQDVEKLKASPPLVISVSSPLQVSGQKLFAHIQNLNFKRYTNTERSRTRTYIISQLKKFGWKPQLQNFSEGVNIFAERQGTDKTAGAILVGAHYDTVAISPGADDNASGVAVALEIARLLGSRPTPRTLQLAFFDKEEAGLLGSQAFTAKVANLQNLHGAIIMDMVGYACYTAGCQQYPANLPITPPSDKGDFLAVVGDTEHLPMLKAFENSHLLSRSSLAKVSKNLPPIFTLPVPLKGLLTPDTLRSDHAPFWLQGVGAVLVTDTANLRTPHYHQASDTPLNIERSFFTAAAQVVVNATNLLLANNSDLDTPVNVSALK
ncbi:MULTISPECIES: M28 family peptidase [Fischerella]|uniref:Peptidase M28 n=1 Tax=Fischerella muscicola CCMEE 5323 TaxID=2019572 RepID=A0A2N6K8F2_FISMU|nr:MULTISPECIES: M28 family peptidase [Fischerella]MBD2433119.1 M28 family peptidase [Fischerella sp. FACHB-380]PLZ93913.1 peptidase M28 [Fischerella muscicola CCMEE 5323]